MPILLVGPLACIGPLPGCPRTAGVRGGGDRHVGLITARTKCGADIACDIHYGCTSAWKDPIEKKEAMRLPRITPQAHVRPGVYQALRVLQSFVAEGVTLSNNDECSWHCNIPYVEQGGDVRVVARRNSTVGAPRVPKPIVRQSVALAKFPMRRTAHRRI